MEDTAIDSDGREGRVAVEYHPIGAEINLAEFPPIITSRDQALKLSMLLNNMFARNRL